MRTYTMTIHEALKLKPGREPSNGELKLDVQRILGEAREERLAKGGK
jgi:hypothetical protein